MTRMTWNVGIKLATALWIGAVVSGCVVVSDRDRCDGRATTSCDTLCSSDDRSDCVTSCDTVCEPVDEVVVVHEDPAPRYGDLGLGWRFENFGGCYEAGVDTVAVSVIGQDTPDGSELLLPCVDYGIDLYDFQAGRYRVVLEGLDYSGAVTFRSSLLTTVYAESVTDLGVVVLEDLYLPPPAPLYGAVALDWAFRYPDADATYDCLYAGVEWVDLVITDAWGEVVFSESVSCFDGPVVIDDLAEGSYSVDLIGVGALDGVGLDLYATAPLQVQVRGALEADLGTVALDRLPGSFGDFDLAWGFAGNACHQEGVDEVVLRIVRADTDLIDDEFVIGCNQQPLVRPTFVPGDYLVELEAVDAYGACWYGLARAGLAPGATTVLDLNASIVACR